jgi:serine O-acetyltransferase
LTVALWRWSGALHRRGMRRGARLVQRLNGLVHHNDLGAGAAVGTGVVLGHRGLGVVVHDNVVLGERVRLWHNVTLAVRAKPGSRHRIVVGDDVMIGANAVVITPSEQTVHIGREARIGAGAVVTGDVPAGATVVGVPGRVIRVDSLVTTVPVPPRSTGAGPERSR